MAFAIGETEGYPSQSRPRTNRQPQTPQSFITLPIPTERTQPTMSSLQVERHTRARVFAGSAGKGVLIGMLSAFGAALFIVIVLGLVYLLRYTARGRIFLDRIGRPGEYDDEQQFAKEEAEALEEMDDIQRAEYLRAKAFIEANPPESAQTDISLSQFLAIQEKGVSAWEFEPELEIANCFVEARTEIEFFDMECSVQSNLPIPKQNDVYYWEAKIYDKPESTNIAIGVSTKPYPMFRLPGYHKVSVAYTSFGDRRFNQPFKPTPSYGPPYVQGDVIGCGYRPRTGTLFFTRNGKKLEDITHTLKTQNLFPTIGATGPCTIHVNFGQAGFVFIEANVKRWGLAPMTGSLAPPPPYGSEQGSILLEGGQAGVQEGQGWTGVWGQPRSHRSAHIRATSRHQIRSPGIQRSPTDISLAQFSIIDSPVQTTTTHETTADDTSTSQHDDEYDTGEGTSAGSAAPRGRPGLGLDLSSPITAAEALQLGQVDSLNESEADTRPPPGYSSPKDENVRMDLERRRSLATSEAASEYEYYSSRRSEDGGVSTPRPGTAFRDLEGGDGDGDERARLLRGRTDDGIDGEDEDDNAEDQEGREGGDVVSPPIPSYEVAVGSGPSERGPRAPKR